ncbi:Kinesin-like protein KIN-14F [Orobanche hederae]
MDQGTSEALHKEPMEEERCLALCNGLILSNVLNKVNPGAVYKYVLGHGKRSHKRARVGCFSKQ